MACKHSKEKQREKNVVSDRILHILEQIEDGLKDMNTGFNLPRECYVDQEFYEFEQEAIFMRNWLCVGRVEDIPNPGDYLRVDVGDEPLVMVRNQEMDVRVFTPVCPHRGHILCEGSGNTGRLFRCPFHAWTFGLDGHMIAAPSMNETVGLKELKAEAHIPSHKVEVWNGFVFMNFDPDAKPLAPTLGKLTKALENYHIDTMVTLPAADDPEADWDWKAQLEAGVEPYHTSYLHGILHDFAHSRLTSFVDFDDEDGAVFHPTGFYYPDAGFNPTGKALMPIIPTLTDAERSQVLFATIPPNLGFGVVPEGAFYYLCLPEGPGKMHLRIGNLYPKESTKTPLFDELYQIQQQTMVLFQEQDSSATSSVQRGNKSRFRKPGRISFQEESLFQFHKWLQIRYSAYAKEVLAAEDAAQTEAAE